jgi:maltose-binding protein MalE
LKVLINHELEGLAAELFAQQVQRFATQTTAKFEVEQRPIEDLSQPMIARVKMNNAPDALLVPSDYATLRDELKLSPIGLDQSNIVDAAVSATEYEGISYGVPVLIGNHLVLFYNKDLIELPNSIEQLITWGKAKSTPPFCLGLDVCDPYWFLPFTNILESIGKTALNLEALTRSLEQYRQLIDSNVVPAFADDNAINAGFLQGDFAAVINGEWRYVDTKLVMADRLGVALLPSYHGQALNSSFNALMLVFPGHSLETEKGLVLLELAKYLQSQAVQQEWVEMANRIPVDKKVFVQFTGVAGLDHVAILEQLKASVPLPNALGMMRFWQQAKISLSELIKDRLDAGLVAKSLIAALEL